jgi:hypothetical protein
VEVDVSSYAEEGSCIEDALLLAVATCAEVASDKAASWLSDSRMSFQHGF